MSAQQQQTDTRRAGFERGDRDVLVLALAAGSDPNDARAVLSDALAQVSMQLRVVAAASELSDAAGPWIGDVENTLGGLARRVEALQAFADRYLEVEFRQQVAG